MTVDESVDVRTLSPCGMEFDGVFVLELETDAVMLAAAALDAQPGFVPALRACRSVAEALDHEGKGDATGTQVVAHPQERAMPKPHPPQAT